MKELHAKLVLIALIPVLVQMEYPNSSPKSAMLQSLAPRGPKTAPDDGSPAPFPSSIQTPTGVEQRRREPVSITYQNGELTIDAFNALLSDVLRAVRDRTGSVIPIPQDANERVNRQIGPGPVMTVLGSLLNETKFNYLIETVSADQNAPVRVVFSLKGRGTTPHMMETPESAVVNAQDAEEEEARETAIAERSALVRQINTRHLQFVQEIQKAQQAVSPEPH